MNFYVVIPARLNSTRLARKLLSEIAGQTILERTYRQAIQSQAKEVIIATDSEEIREVATSFGAPCVMTQASHVSGTDRTAEVVSLRQFNDDAIVVNVQGDEPFIAPDLIDKVAEALMQHPKAQVATLAEPIREQSHYDDPNVVKVVTDKTDRALYFSRASIPFCRDKNTAFPALCFKHIGIYAYRAAFLKQYAALEISPLEEIEKLEQLRVLWHGYNIQVAITEVPAGMIEVNTHEDLEKARALF